jgi:hypothetical protein
MVMPIAGGIGLATRRDGGPQTGGIADAYFDGMLRGSAQQVWSEHADVLRQHVLTALATRDRIARGVTLTDLTMSLPAEVDLAVERDEHGDLLVHVTALDCCLHATARTKDDPAGWAPPTFSVSFGLDLTYRIALSPINAPLRCQGFERTRILATTMDVRGFGGDQALLVNVLIDFFAGPAHRQIVETYVALVDVAPYVDAALAPLNAELSRLASAGYWFLDVVVTRLDGMGVGARGGVPVVSLPGARPGRLDLLLTAVGFERSGAIEGEISWPRALGCPTTEPEATVESAAAEEDSLQLAAVSAAVASERTTSWTAVTEPSSDFALSRPWSPDRGTIIALPDFSGSGRHAAPARVVAPAAALAESAIATGLADLPLPVRLAAARDLRAAVADRFVVMVGGAERFAELQAEFRRGAPDFVVPVSVTMPGGAGPVADELQVGTLAGMWSDDDEVHGRRRFLLVDVPIGASLTVRCDLGPGYTWAPARGPVECSGTGWTGQVTVLRAPPAVSLAEAMGDQVEVRLPDRSRVFSRTSTLEERGIVLVGGRPHPDTEVAPAPQPAPPRHFGHFGPVRAEKALLTTAERRTPAATVVKLAAHEDGQWGTSVTEASADSLAAVISIRRLNPTGRGAVRGIDFTVEVAPPRV